jgi:hypothetical protein
MKMENDEMEKEIRLQVADVIINLNLIESKISDIISKYINSVRQLFVREILLNSILMGFSTKFKILEYILKSEKINEPKDFSNSIQVIMNKRNIIAHSDTLLKFEDIVDFDVEWTHEGPFKNPIYGPAEPILSTITKGKVDYDSLSKTVEDFSKYFKIALIGLKEIDSKLFD